MTTPIEWLVPAEGMSVIDPDTGKPVPAEGARKRMTPFWQRRVDEKSMFMGERPKPAPKQPTEEQDESSSSGSSETPSEGETAPAAASESRPTRVKKGT